MVKKYDKWKLREVGETMVMGRDVGLKGIVGLSLKALVGKFSYRAMNPRDRAQWDSSVWAPLLDYIPTISILQKGCYGFVFRKEEHGFPLFFKQLRSMVMGS